LIEAGGRQMLARDLFDSAPKFVWLLLHNAAWGPIHAATDRSRDIDS
jgi:hypothetical protein